jgi:hypothetical protein
MAAAENAGAAADRVFDEVDHALDVLCSNHRADVSAGVAAGTDTQLFCFGNATRREFIARGLLDKETLDR